MFSECYRMWIVTISDDVNTRKKVNVEGYVQTRTFSAWRPPNKHVAITKFCSVYVHHFVPACSPALPRQHLSLQFETSKEVYRTSRTNGIAVQGLDRQITRGTLYWRLQDFKQTALTPQTTLLLDTWSICNPQPTQVGVLRVPHFLLGHIWTRRFKC